MKLTKEQKQQLINTLSSPYGRVALRCDGYQVDLVVERAAALAYRVVTYINGQWKGAWVSGSESHPEQKFLRKSVRPTTSKAKLLAMEKKLGKRYFKQFCKDYPYWTSHITTYDFTWASGKAAINHLGKVCDSIQILTPDIA